MAPDFFVAKFWLPMLIITLVLVGGFFYLKKRGIEKEFNGITGQRIILGVVGAVLAIIIYSGVFALQLGFNKVELGHI